MAVPPRLFLDQTKKTFWDTGPPPAPHPLCQVLDPALHRLPRDRSLLRAGTGHAGHDQYLDSGRPQGLAERSHNAQTVAQ